MSKTSEPTPLADLESAAKSAQRARATAETATAKARQAVATADAELDGLLAGLRAGDSSITSDDVNRARTEVERRKLLLEAAQAELQDARWAESHAVATYSAELIHSGGASREELDAAVRKASTDVAKSLQKVIQAVRTRADAIQVAKVDGLAAGLDKADPMAPVRIRLQGLRRTLVVHGVEVQEVSVVEAVEEAIADALVAADVNLEVTRA